jgi:3-oxoacyl-[acyl-carrier protein] reductase
MTTHPDPQRQRALVTQATEFAGPPAVAALCNDGFRVIASDVAFADCRVAKEFEAKHPGAITTADCDPEALLAQCWQALGGLDVLVCNDAHPAIHGPLESLAPEALTATLHALVERPFRLLQLLVPRLKAQGHGNIVMITSCRTELPMPGGAVPDMARAAANALVRSLAIELAPFGIPVNAIAPNFLYSEAYFPRAKFIDDPVGRAYIESVVPAGRLGEPAEIGELVRYLATLKGSFHTGSIIKFAGGWPAAPMRP